MLDYPPSYSADAMPDPPKGNSKVRLVQRYKDEVVANASRLPKEEYKRIKRMNKYELVVYLQRVSADGFKHGYEAARKEFSEAADMAPGGAPAEAATPEEPGD